MARHPIEGLALGLQRSAGNRATGQVLSRMQPEAAGERSALEREAERSSQAISRDWERGGPPTASIQDGALDPVSRRFLEDRMGQDLRGVRIHDDEASHRLTDRLGAEGVTIGSDVHLARQRRSSPHRLRNVLAHELTHVVQQASSGVSTLQAKLRLTGKQADLDRALALLNSGLYLHQVTIGKTGEVSLAQMLGPPAQGHPTPTEQALASRLKTIIDDAKDTVISVSAGSTTVGGSYVLGDIDIADLETTGVSTLAHELEEQHQKQVKGLAYGSETTGAHAAGIKAESEVKGATRGAEKLISSKLNSDGTLDAVVEVPYTDPKGKVVTETWTIKSNNIVSVTRK